MLAHEMTRAQADAHRAQLLQTATTTGGLAGHAAWCELRDFNAARRVRAVHRQQCEQQRQGLAVLGRGDSSHVVAA